MTKNSKKTIKNLEKIFDILLKKNFQEVLFGNLRKFKKSGVGYMACCPFHKDHNPSFSIAKDKPLWNCFGCGRSGNWLQYLEEKEV